MRTTIEIDDGLLGQAKQRAAEEGNSLRHVVESALRLYLGKRPPRKSYQLRWRTESGRILPGVDLSDRDNLFDLIQRRD